MTLSKDLELRFLENKMVALDGNLFLFFPYYKIAKPLNKHLNLNKNLNG